MKIIRDKNGKFVKTDGIRNPRWKGNTVGYSALHQWIKNHKPKKDLCEHCKKSKKLELANISGEYKRNINDFIWLCKSCHAKKDYKDGRWFLPKYVIYGRDELGHFIKRDIRGMSTGKELVGSGGVMPGPEL